MIVKIKFTTNTYTGISPEQKKALDVCRKALEANGFTVTYNGDGHIIKADLSQ